jgi:hypothetical protein
MATPDYAPAPKRMTGLLIVIGITIYPRTGKLDYRHRWIIVRAAAKVAVRVERADSSPLPLLASPPARLPVIRYAKIHATKHRPWLSALLARRPTKVAAIALANKIARMAWAMSS